MRHFKFTDMRRHKLNWIWIILLGLFVGSCEDYLDRSPDDGLSEDDVYKDYKKVSEVVLPFLKYESNGTIKLFGILPSIFEALDTGGVLFIDELENGLHPLVVEFIIKLFN